MFRLELLPAEYGDALWIEYGDARSPRRVLIDCGTQMVYDRLKQRIAALPARNRRFELFVVTHVDLDHIGGALALLRAHRDLGVEFRDVWFNGYVHLKPGGRVPPREDPDVLGPLQGEELTETIVNLELPWNRAFDGGALVVPENGALPSRTLESGLKLTLLSPLQKQLDRLEPVWEKACKKAKIAPGGTTSADDDSLGEVEDQAEEDDQLGDPSVAALAATAFKPDPAKPNGSSIALLAEFERKRMLLAADAYAPVLLDSLRRLPQDAGGKLKIDAFKLSHHGSRKNTSADLVRAVACPHYLVSTNGKQFKHPDLEATARVIRHGGPGVTLSFNYRTEFNDMWESSRLQRGDHPYAARYPSGDESGIALEL